MGYSSGMKHIAAFLIGLFAAGLLTAHAQQNADSQYLSIYSAIQQADALAASGDPHQVLAGYNDALSQLQQLQRAFPDWNTKIVTFRLKYLNEKIADLKLRIPPPPPAAIATNASPVAFNADEAEVATLRRQLEATQTENAALLAKLKEALGVQPAMAEAGELAKLQAQIMSLMKENDLLKAAAPSERTGTNSSLPPQTALAEANQKLTALNTSLTNALAKDQVELKQARQQATALQSDVQVKKLENTALENRIQQLLAGTNTALPNQTENESRIRELTQERDNLLAKLGAANQQLYGTRKPDAVAQVDQLSDQIRTLRDRLAVAEAQPVPFTSEELALLKQSAPQPAAARTQKKSLRELPPGSAALVAEAQNFFAAHQYDRAETNYLKVLQYDPNNALVLGNLAAIEMQEGKLADSEKHIKTALAQDPNDAFNLATLGYLKFRQDEFDEALDILSRATKLDPRNPEILNYLGVTLSQKGQRAQAETALRKAIELNPGYAAAHNNLAAIYISQDPPLVELARWHYQKALDAGQPPNPYMEKALDAKGAPPAAP
ncbi:MAG: tetratricopeptide repeat protein [Limisphaerales bacterium]